MGGADQQSNFDYDELAEKMRALSGTKLYNAISNLPFNNRIDTTLLFLGFMCLYLVNEDKQRIELKSLSDTEQYRRAVDKFSFDPSEYYLFFDKNKDNTIVQAIASGEPRHTLDWATLNRGETPVETVRLNQANSGIAYTEVVPLSGSLRGAVMYGFYQYPEKIGKLQQDFMRTYTKLVSDVLER